MRNHVHGQVAWQNEVVERDVLALLRWVMNAVDVYFHAVNVKGRRWIPKTEAMQLIHHCRTIVDSCQFYHAC